MSLAVKLHLFDCCHCICEVALTRNWTVIFLHSRVERTTQRRWMCVFFTQCEARGWSGGQSSACRFPISDGAHRVTRRTSPGNVRFSPIAESTARLIVLESGASVYLLSWHYLLQLPCRIQTNWMRCGVWINSGSGVRSKTDVSVSFAAKSLPAGKSR